MYYVCDHNTLEILSAPYTNVRYAAAWINKQPDPTLYCTMSDYALRKEKKDPGSPLFVPQPVQEEIGI